MKYETFQDYLLEVEGFSSRAERLVIEFGHLPVDEANRIVAWLRGAFEAARLPEPQDDV